MKITSDPEYKHWLMQLKQKVATSQIKAAIKVNTELLTLYWDLGKDITIRQQQANWGDKFLSQLSKDLMAEFPQMKGFSVRNLKYIRQWYQFFANDVIGQQLVAQLVQIPWGHNIQIITKCKNISEAKYYVINTLQQGWSRNVLIHQIESGLYVRDSKAQNNFEQTLPKSQSDLAIQTLKDPYIFDFLTLSKEHNERELEQGLVEHITQFLLELGSGFAYMGKQFSIYPNYLDMQFQSYQKGSNARRDNEEMSRPFELAQRSSGTLLKLPKGKDKKHLFSVINFTKGIAIGKINSLPKCFFSLAEILHLQVVWV